MPFCGEAKLWIVPLTCRSTRGIIRWKEALNHERSTAWLKLAASHHSRW
jgi:hypothetical protein